MQGYLGRLQKQPTPLIMSQGMRAQQALLISVSAHLMKVKDCIPGTRVELCFGAGGVNSMRFSGSINNWKLSAIRGERRNGGGGGTAMTELIGLGCFGEERPWNNPAEECDFHTDIPEENKKVDLDLC